MLLWTADKLESHSFKSGWAILVNISILTVPWCCICWYETSSLSTKVVTLWSCGITLKIQPTFDRMKITLQTTTLIHYRLHPVWSNILDAISPRTAEIIWRWGNLWYETSSLSRKVITLWSCRITLKIQPTFNRMKITLQTTTLIHYR